MKSSEPYSSSEVAMRAGISYRTLDYWLRTGVAVASIAPAKGSGSARRFSQDDLERVELTAALRAMGVDLELIRANYCDPYRTLEVLAQRIEPLVMEHRAKMQRVA